MAAASVTTHIAAITASPPAVVGVSMDGVVDVASTAESTTTTNVSRKSMLNQESAATAITTFLISSTNAGHVDEEDSFTTLTSVSPGFVGTSSSAASSAMMPELGTHTHSRRLPLPLVATVTASSKYDDNLEIGGEMIASATMAAVRLVDNSTQTDALSDEEQLLTAGNTELGTDVYGESEHAYHALAALASNNDSEDYGLMEFHEADENKEMAITNSVKEFADEAIGNANESQLFYGELNVFDMNRDCNECNEFSRFVGDKNSAKSNSLSQCDNCLQQTLNAINDGGGHADEPSPVTGSALANEHSVNQNQSFESQSSNILDDLEPADCTCNASSHFGCGCDETAANCTYQERIIDYDNFRIIEHVIDCSHDSYCKHSRKMHCTGSWEGADEDNVVEENKELNFACRELVTFIGESYQIMKAQEQTENIAATTPHSPLESTRPVKDIAEEDTYCEENMNIGHFIVGPQIESPFMAEIVDDNNNKGRTKASQALSGSSDTIPSGVNKSISATITASCSVSNPMQSIKKTEHRLPKKELPIAKVQLPTPSVTLALKALKSKLTPLAPSFHPARKKQTTTSSTTAAASSLFAHEKTAIYYQPQPPKQQQQQQQHYLQQTTTTTMLHRMSLHHHSQAQQEQHPQPQQHQQPQVSPMAQQSYSKNSFQQQPPQPLLQNLQPSHNFVTSSIEHQHNCTQHANSLGGVPHIYLHSVPGSAALASSALHVAVGNTPQAPHAPHLYPVQVISLTAAAAETPSKGSSNSTVSQQRESSPASTIVAAVGDSSATWPFMDAAPVFIDSSGELRTFCPTHGPPALNTGAITAATNSNGMTFNQSIAINVAHGNISSQLPHMQHYQQTMQRQTQAQAQAQPQPQLQPQSLATTSGATPASIMATNAIPSVSINATNRACLQQHQQQQQTQIKSLNQTQNQSQNHLHHQQQHIQHNHLQAHYHQQQQHQLQQQQQQQLESVSALQISGKAKLYRGPTPVQMVSQNRPTPIPVQVQVPQGQVMQQYVNESGPFAHVVLSPQYQQLHASQGHIHAPFLAANGTSHFYSPIQAGFPGGGPAHFHALSSGHVQTQQPPQQPQALTAQQQQTSTHQQPLSHSPSPPNNYHKDERSQRQHTKLLRKLEKQRELNPAMSTPTNSPSPRRTDINTQKSHSPVLTNNSSNTNGPNHSQNNTVLNAGMLIVPSSLASSSVTSNSTTGLNLSLQSRNQNHVQQQQTSSQQSSSNHNLNSRRISQRNGSVPSNAHQINSTNGCIASSVETSEDSMEGMLNAVDDEEDYQSLLIEQLSSIKKPKVINLTSRSAKIVWEAAAITDPQINTRELRYNVLFSDRVKDCKYKSLYKGESYDCIVQDLQPGQVYIVRLQVHYEKLQGSASDPTEFTTPPCEPDQPMPPKLVMRTKNSLHLRWTNPSSNGSPIQHYILEYDEGKTNFTSAGRSARQNSGNEGLNFVEATKTKGKHYTLTKLQPSTLYYFRLAAVNDVGASLFSSVCSFSTSCNPPSAPKPPKLQSSTSTSIRIWWERRQQDDDYVLQIFDRESGHGYLNAYNGPDCTHECNQLRRATSYQFRLRAENEAGSSPWSNEVSFQTSPEKPGKPGKPHVKGKIHGTHFRARWDPPADTGGAEILRYFLEITSGSKFERVYSGADTETTCDRLQPGTAYQLRTSCEGPAGLSPYSDIAHITSEAVVPAAPPPPYYDNPPGPFAAVLRLDKPDYNGGSQVLEFEVQMRRPLDGQFDIGNKTNDHSIVYRGRDTYCVVKDLQPGCSYEVQVRAINRIGAGAWSSWFRFSAAAAPPNAPTDLKVLVKSATHLLVNWQEPTCNGAPIVEYRLESASVQNDFNSELEKSSIQMPAFQTCYQGAQTSVELRNLLPFTMYYFRVNASNAAGVSKWTTNINERTPAAVPAAPHIKDCEFTATEVSLNWTEPECNGAPITAYTIEYSEKSITTTDTNTVYTVTGLLPETTYKFRLQAINKIGPGPFSAYAKLTTLPSPPTPPALECTGVGHNFIKLKWGDGKNLDFVKYYVEMFVQRAKEFQIVYSGTNSMCKVNKLQERTAYTFRIYASTDRAGIGDYSHEYIFSTTPTLPNSIKAPRVAMEGAAACLLTHGAGGAAGFIPSGMLPETPTSFIAGLGNLSLGVPLTLEWQNSKNTFSDRIEYVLQYAIGKDGDYRRIYRGLETKFTIENLEPGTMYQFRVCPIRVTTTGEELFGQYTSAFRYQVPHIASLDDIDGNILGNISSVFGSANNSGHAPMGCHGHSHLAHHVHTLHTHHSHNHPPHSHSHHSSRQSSSSLHHRSVSASAASPNGCSSSSGNNNSNGSSNNGGSTIVIGPNAIGLIPLGTSMANELGAVGFASCDDPMHHHHHHHHQFHGGNIAAGLEAEVADSTTASFLASTANNLLANNVLLAHGSSSTNHGQHGAVRRCISKITTIYTNRKRFTDQEKAVLFMVCFLFFTFLFATLVKALMR
ncbi:uncharacterized protein LOC118741473 [Rhagoletis pomonella]|uniref:uncharacterized protein LOC118741473 n=1 Tax=Rhagoletis pomonella TaxID=28610 RepID=UPI0017806519|nr:uncharacterized protein LOC118741473 [Rhagoletis pomonella]